MVWLSKIFKGSSDNVSEGGYDVRWEADPVENHPSTSWDSWSENEDIDRAIALSLSEEDPGGNNVTDSELEELEEDEQLARALQESLNVESPPALRSRNDSVTGNGYENGYGYGHGYDSLYQPIQFPHSTGISCIRAAQSY